MVESLTTLHPLVEWAQRETYLYLTVEVDDVAHLQISDKALHVKSVFAEFFLLIFSPMLICVVSHLREFIILYPL